MTLWQGQVRIYVHHERSGVCKPGTRLFIAESKRQPDVWQLTQLQFAMRIRQTGLLQIYSAI